MFDFSSWPLAPTIVIPGYRAPNPPYRIPLETARAEEKAEAHAVFRAQVMNAHQACLTTSEVVVKHGGGMTGFPVTAWNTHKAIAFDTLTPYHDDVEDIHALAQNVLNNKDQVPRDHPFPRRVLELEVVEYSLDLLDSILLTGDVILVQMIEAVYMAECRRREKRFGEAVVLAWGVCEQLVSSVWNKLLDDTERSGGGSRMPKNRRKKLTGRDYPASVMVEMLEIKGKIDQDTYRLLEIARKVRNKWAHEMRVPSEKEVRLCLQSAERLLGQIRGVQLSLVSGGRGGVPQWPVWMWEHIKAQRGP